MLRSKNSYSFSSSIFFPLNFFYADATKLGKLTSASAFKGHFFPMTFFIADEVVDFKSRFHTDEIYFYVLNWSDF